MGAKYTTQTAPTYADDTPANDGSQVASNRVDINLLRTNYTHPIKDLADAINSQLVGHFDNGPRAITATTATVATDYGKILECTNTIAVDLLASSTAGAGYHVTLKNAGSGTVTARMADSTDTVDGVTNGTVALSANQAREFIVNAGATGYMSRAFHLLDASGNVTLTGDITVTGSGANVLTLGDTAASAGVIRIENNATIRARNNADSANIIIAQVDTSDVLKLGDANLTINPSSGDVAVTGALTVTGGQVAFPSTQSASADANTLDDYEEGTFTPTIQDDSLSDSEGQAYNIQEGTYTKIGNLCFYQIYISISDLGTLTTSQGAQIAGLPFTVANTNNTGVAAVSGSLLAITQGYSLAAECVKNTTRIQPLVYDLAAGVSDMLISELSVNGTLILSGHYTVA